MISSERMHPDKLAAISMGDELCWIGDDGREKRGRAVGWTCQFVGGHTHHVLIYGGTQKDIPVSLRKVVARLRPGCVPITWPRE